MGLYFIYTSIYFIYTHNYVENNKDGEQLKWDWLTSYRKEAENKNGQQTELNWPSYHRNEAGYN